ncbi:Fis family transcriptional regulator [Photorhabdus luminescens]|uniref:DNA 3'-5' helicase II n=1 Tax=Photorhabdus akhurstii TaxID=171438 RepID=A0ABX8LQ65_9GAMM|nr:ATP-dependent helicase [Photorhabdus akhurstii]QXF32682.1 Fis family transcriptional regulator [Photorhabdus akhurstii]UJD74478.1 Fis family transcriptional regulator [Photorhabdus luminescens]
MTEVIDTKTVDDEIYGCLDLDNPKSFFLFAGAGSGKTRSLVEVLKRFREHNIHRLRVKAQQVAIITYTNAACDEIKRRLEFDSAFSVSTIHSFAWELIKPHQHDIRESLRVRLQSDIVELEEAQRKGRAGTKAAEDRPKQIAAKLKRLESLSNIRKFTYNPNGENLGKDSLNHAEVIGITAELLISRPLLQQILTRKFPVLLVDESQDTKKELIDALFVVQSLHQDKFSLGLFGDIMQRIYNDGKEDLGLAPLPDGWLTPKKEYNHRCPRRVVKLINKIRAEVDQNLQQSAKLEEGFVRLFIADTSDGIDKEAYERFVCQKMAEITADDLWIAEKKHNKTLTLEHHMAAQRGGFASFFNSLYEVDKLRTGLLDGTHAGITFFSERVLPLIKSLDVGNHFAVSRIVNKYSPLISKECIEQSAEPKAELAKAKDAVDGLYVLWRDDADPSLINILKEVQRTRLFNVPDVLTLIAERQDRNYEKAEDDNDRDPVVDAWDTALMSRFSEFKEYVAYISDESRFGTHQGIKGLEFPRVIVILDDEEARGFLFSYDKLFGAKPPTATDIRNQKEGKETSIDRTRRLFYVTCSRAEKSLAIVAYTNEPNKVKTNIMSQNWFEEHEIISCQI